MCNRSDVVEIETWCQGEGRIGTRRDWILKDYATGQVIGRATRCIFILLFAAQNLQKCSRKNDIVQKAIHFFSYCIGICIGEYVIVLSQLPHSR